MANDDVIRGSRPGITASRRVLSAPHNFAAYPCHQRGSAILLPRIDPRIGWFPDGGDVSGDDRTAGADVPRLGEAWSSDWPYKRIREDPDVGQFASRATSMAQTGR